MLKRLNTDKSLSAFAGQFVPLKIATDGGPEWSKWARKYRVETNGIPILYVVRADGQMLYGKSGSLRGDALPKMLLDTLRQSGRTLSPAEAKLLENNVPAARAALAMSDSLTAARSLGNLKKLGALGTLQSYATLALEANKLVEETRAIAEKNIALARKNLANKENSFASVLLLLEGDKAYVAFPKLRSANTAALSVARRDTELADAIEQAKGIERARRYADSKLASVRKKAIPAYQMVIRKYPKTIAEKMATEELAKLDPDAAIAAKNSPKASPQVGKFRSWTDSTGSFKIKAKLVSFVDGKVTLQKLNGSKVVLRLEQLSKADRDLLRE